MFVALMFIVFAELTASQKDLGNIDCKTTMFQTTCQMNEVCKAHCNFPCHQTDGVIWGTEIYTYDSPLCKSAVHDLRISTWDASARDFEVQRIPYKNVYRGSVRFGVSTLNYGTLGYPARGSFVFLSPRVSEKILDVASVHENFMFREGESHVQTCFLGHDSTRKVSFNTYSNRGQLPTSLFKAPPGVTIGDVSVFKMLWPEDLPPLVSAGFQCIPDKSMLSIVTSLAFRKDAYFLSSKPTVTYNINESVILQMKETDKLSYLFLWRKDGLPVNPYIPKRTERTSLTLPTVQRGSTGIYSLEYKSIGEAFARRGVVRLIVRGCPEGYYGINCREECPACQNGGMCHDITGVCICAPGFNGTLCEQACAPGHFGQKCTMSCSMVNDSKPAEEACRGLLICLPDPYGCSCASGFTGLSCDQTCPPGSYGSGCSQMQQCHCTGDLNCDRFSGLCLDGCHSGWHGTYCNVSYPAFIKPPTMRNVSKDSVILQFPGWDPHVDAGNGSAESYLLVYKEANQNTPWSYGPRVPSGKFADYIVELRNLEPGREYLAGVIVVDVSGNRQEKIINPLTFRTVCSKPMLPPEDIEFDTADVYINVSWTLPPQEKWNCWTVDAMVIYNSSLGESRGRVHHQYYTLESRPFTPWTVRVCLTPPEQFPEDLTCSETFSVSTQEAAPGKVKSLSSFDAGPDYVTLEWEEPIEKNGIIRYYIVRYYQNAWRHECTLRSKITVAKRSVTGLNVTLKNLNPSASYIASVTAVTVMKGQGMVIVLKTTESIPSGVPRNLELLDDKSKIKWEEPLCSTTNGKITRYLLSIRGQEPWDSDEKTFNITETMFTFPRLIPFTTYSVKVFAGNRVGLSSNFSEEMFLTEPSSPPPPKDLAVYSRSPTALFLSWYPPYPPQGLLSHYAIRYEDTTESSVAHMTAASSDVMCKDEIRKNSHCFILTDLKTNHLYKVELKAFNHNDEEGSETVTVVGETSETLPEAPASANVSEKTDSSISIIWKEPFISNGKITSYRVNLTVIDNFNPSFINYFISDVVTNIDAREYTFKGLLPAALCSISIEASTSVGFGPSIDLIVPTSIRTPIVEKEPIVTNKDDQEVTIQLFPVDDSGGPISAYFVVVDPIFVNPAPKKRSVPVDILKPQENCSIAGLYTYVAARLENVFENGTTFVVGDGSCECGYSNPPLKIGITYRLGVIVQSHYGSEEKYSEIKFMSETVQITIAEKQRSSNSAAVAIGFLIPLLIIICIFTIYIYVKRPRALELAAFKLKILPPKNRKEEFAACNEALDEITNIDTESLCEVLSNKIAVKDLEEYVKTNLLNNKIRAEYMCLPRGQKYPCNVAKYPENKAKNRYGNLLPYDHSRVVLDVMEEEPYSDYIHANYIDGYKKENKYIATQGPKSSTIYDFWRMVWKEGSCKILMVTNFIENGKGKCEKYWTESTECYNDITVTLQESESFADYAIRTFDVLRGGASREVKHFHFMTWPDHGVPMYTTPVIDFLQKARDYNPKCEAPVIIHCSAGIGRTGTVILLDSMVEMGVEEKAVDILGQLCTMRRQRSNIVENIDQYILVHNALVETLCQEKTSIPCSKLLPEVKRLRTLDKGTGISPMEKQFQLLNKQCPHLQYKDIRTPHLPENKEKNRHMDILPPERARPILPEKPENSRSGYINAVYIDGYRQKDAFVVTQCPLPNTIADFWCMVYEIKSKTIVLLQDVNFSDPLNPQFWPMEGIQGCEEFRIECQSYTTDDELSVFNLSLAKQSEETSLTITLLHLKKWSVDKGTPSTCSTLLTLIEKVEKLQQQAKHVITVSCLDGKNACGIFCAAVFLYNKMKLEQEVDVFQAVKSVRVNRPRFVVDLEQYEYLYKFCLAYMDTFESYANFV